MNRRSRPLVVPVAACSLAAALGGCATAEDYANDPRPPAPVSISGALTDGGLSLNPERVGAGQLKIIISNQTERATPMRLQRAGTGTGEPGLRAETQGINPGGTASLSVEVEPGRYELRAVGSGASPVTLRVDSSRPSSSEDLLLP